MSYHFDNAAFEAATGSARLAMALAALDAAKAAGDVAALMQAADMLASCSAAPKPARKPRRAASDAPAWFEAVAKSKNRAQFSLVVEFSDGVITRANAWQDSGKPIAVGRALRVACEFYRARARRLDGSFDCAVPDMVAARTYEAWPAVTDDKRTRLKRAVDGWRRILAEREIDNAKAPTCQGEFDIRSAAWALAQSEAHLAALNSPAPGACAATDRFLSRIATEADDAAAAGEPHPRAADRAAWDEGQAAWADDDEAFLAEIEAEPSEPAYPDAEEAEGPCNGALTGTPDIRAALEGASVAAALPYPSMVAPSKRRRPRKVSEAERLEAERVAIASMPLPTSQAQWRALSSRMRGWKRDMERRAGTQGSFGLSVGPDAHRQLRIERHARLYAYNGASPLSYLGMIAFHRRQYLAGIMPETRVLDARDFAQASRREGPVPLPDLGRPYRLCGGAPNEVGPACGGAATRNHSKAACEFSGRAGKAQSGRSRLAAPLMRPERGSPPLAISGQSAPISGWRYWDGRPLRESPLRITTPCRAKVDTPLGPRTARAPLSELLNSVRTAAQPHPAVDALSRPSAMVSLSIPSRAPSAVQRARPPP